MTQGTGAESLPAGDSAPVAYDRIPVYDRMIADHACEWLEDAIARKDGDPWVLYLGFVAPHFPLVVPAEFYDLYPLETIA